MALALRVAVAGCASSGSAPSITTTTTNGTFEQIPVEVSKPEGACPFPAVVIMHDCSGLGSRSSGAPGRWAKELVGRGHVVIMPDSFSTRGHPDGVCTDPSPGGRGATTGGDPAAWRDSIGEVVAFFGRYLR